jgi:hypothetical protein
MGGKTVNPKHNVEIECPDKDDPSEIVKTRINGVRRDTGKHKQKIQKMRRRT